MDEPGPFTKRNMCQRHAYVVLVASGPPTGPSMLTHARSNAALGGARRRGPGPEHPPSRMRFFHSPHAWPQSEQRCSIRGATWSITVSSLPAATRFCGEDCCTSKCGQDIKTESTECRTHIHSHTCRTEDASLFKRQPSRPLATEQRVVFSASSGWTLHFRHRYKVISLCLRASAPGRATRGRTARTKT